MTNRNHRTLHLSASFDRQLVNCHGESVRYLVVDVVPPAIERETRVERLPLNLAIVIDASGSMSGTPIEAAKAAAIAVARSLKPEDRLSVISFASDVIVHCDALTQTEGGRAEAEQSIRGLRTRGSTNMAAGWLAGCECVARVMDRCGAPTTQQRNHVMLLSDGHANDGETNPAVLEQHARELRARGIVNSTIGIGLDYSPTQLQAIAEAGGGRMHDAELSQEIAEVMLAELQETLHTSVENFEVLIDAPAGVRIETVGDLPMSCVNGTHQCVLGSLVASRRRSVVFKMTMPTGSPGSSLQVVVGAAWRWPGCTLPQEHAPITCTVTFASPDECERQHRSNDLATIVAQLWLAAIVRRATSLNADGAYSQAATYVEREGRYFKRYVEGLSDAPRLLLQLSNFAPRVSEVMHGRMRKESLLASYKMLRQDRDVRSRQNRSVAEYMEELLNQEQPRPR